MVRSRSVSRRVGPPRWRARRVPDRVLARRPDAQALHTNAAPVPRSRAKGSARTETATAATAAKETPWLCLPTLRLPTLRLPTLRLPHATERISFVCLLVHMKILAGSKLPERVSGHYWDTGSEKH